MASYEDLKKANESIKTTTLKRKTKTGDIVSTEYAEVNQRIKAFRMVYPEGFIDSHFVSNEGGVCVMVSEVGYYTKDFQKVVLGVGHAYEKEGSTFINQTSYIENAETSSVGRALGMAGFGIDVSIASFEEVSNAIAQQEQKETETETKAEQKATPRQIEYLSEKYKGENLEKLLKANGIEKLEDLSLSKASDLIAKLKKGEKKG